MEGPEDAGGDIFPSVHTDEANVKVRDGLLDIKTKVGETPEGYEIFQPRGKFQLPVKKPAPHDHSVAPRREDGSRWGNLRA